jgi:hypothetical protein
MAGSRTACISRLIMHCTGVIVISALMQVNIVIARKNKHEQNFFATTVSVKSKNIHTRKNKNTNAKSITDI